MRALPLITLLLLSFAGAAQNWALVNPAYKYNYSDDGTGRISNQIRITQVDTLGPDSFLYQINLLAKPCPTCTDCDLRLHIPQFLQRSCAASPNGWHFTGPSDLVLHPHATLNQQWAFDEQNGTIGTLVDASSMGLLGLMDSVKTMVTSLNDTIIWSKDHGIIEWHLHNGARLTLVGVDGPNVGNLIPTINDFFPYQPGDDVQLGYSNWANMHSTQGLIQFHIQERSEGVSSITLTGTAYSSSYHDGWIYIQTNYGPFTWTIDQYTVPGFRMLFSYPQELVDLGTDPDGVPLGFNTVARHRLDMEGNYLIEADTVNDLSIFPSVDTVLEDCAPMSFPGPCSNDLRFRSGFGLVAAANCEGTSGWSQWTQAAIISSDTLGNWQDASYLHIGFSEPQQTKLHVCPNPAASELRIVDLPIGSWVRVFDPQGRLIKTLRTLEPNPSLDLTDLPCGTYSIELADGARQRFVIAR